MAGEFSLFKKDISRITCPRCGWEGPKKIMKKKTNDGYDYRCLTCGYIWGDTIRKLEEERLENTKKRLRADGWEDL